MMAIVAHKINMSTHTCKNVYEIALRLQPQLRTGAGAVGAPTTILSKARCLWRFPALRNDSLVSLYDRDIQFGHDCIRPVVQGLHASVLLSGADEGSRMSKRELGLAARGSRIGCELSRDRR